MRSRPVAPRARRMAAAVASVPEDTRRTFSTEGTSRHRVSASSTSAACGAPNDVPFAAAAAIAASTGGGAWPQRGGAVAEGVRAPRAHVVHVAFAAPAHEPRALAALEEPRVAAHAAERAHRRVHAAGHDRLRPAEQLATPRVLHRLLLPATRAWRS